MKSFEKLKTKLAELFQLDQADLDFGIYRIMNARRDEVTRFLDQDLISQVRKAFKEYDSADRTVLKKQLEEAEKGARTLGVEPDGVPKVKELRAKYETSSVDIAALEKDVYEHLYSFFSRYYDEGDFISLRRYKEGVYAIPYEGDEVKLHWANHDQYYIKTTEFFRDYTFKTPSGHRVHFKIAEADTEKDNIKAANGNERRFLLHGDKPVAEENSELFIHFEYRPDGEKRRQDTINEEVAKRVFRHLGTDSLSVWQHHLSAKWIRSDGTETDKTILDKHLFDYTRRNTFDYFIHKNLGGFLRRELDFYIKNEVMRLDDIEEESSPRVEQYLSKIKVIRLIAHKIIDFLAQIENFQKKLWLKKKFVVETNYCVTLDRVPEELYPEIASNDMQRKEWVKLFAIDEIEKDLAGKVDYTVPLTVEFLNSNPYLMLDTTFFTDEFKHRLLTTIDDINSQCNGLLIHSENFQALKLIANEYEEFIRCIYIDPPYNTAGSEIIYKNRYKHSSWLALLQDRVNLARRLISREGVIEVAIDDAEFFRLQGALNQILGDANHIANIAILHNPKGREQAFVSDAHDYTLLYAKDINRLSLNRLKLSTDELQTKYPKEDTCGRYRELPLRRRGTAPFREDRPYMYFPFVHNPSDGTIKLIDKSSYKKIYVEGRFDDPFIENLKKEHKNKKLDLIFPIREDGSLGRWRWGYDRCLKECANGIFFVTGRKAPTIYHKDYSKNTMLPKSLWFSNRYDASTKGTNLLKHIIPHNPFDYPKSLFTVEDLIQIGAGSNDNILDFFAGSGTTGHAVINLNRQDGGQRKYILVEMGDYFETVLKPRIMKVVYSKDWKDGKPVSREGISHMFKYIRLESYEDALGNIQLSRTDKQKSLLDAADGFRESYMLKYMLDIESKGSHTLLNIDHFDDPWSYKLLVGAGSVGETRSVNVDLIETFNWLLGLKVKHIDRISLPAPESDATCQAGGFQVVEGENPEEQKVLVIWRKIRNLDKTDPKKISAAREKANRVLEKFFRKQQYNTLDSEFDLIYVNGDNNLMNIPVVPEKEGVEPRYKVRLIEEEFKRLMFDVKDV